MRHRRESFGRAGLAGVICSLVATALAAPVLAQGPEMPLGKWWKLPRMVEQLKLKPEQQGRIEEIFSKNRRPFIDLKADVDRRSVDLEELLSKKESDPARIAAATDALEQAKGRLGKARTMMIVEMKGVLSDEQWRKILDLRDEWRRQRLEERRGARPFQQRGPAQAPAEPRQGSSGPAGPG